MNVSVKEIQAAGGLAKWQQKAARQKTPEEMVAERLEQQLAEQRKPRRKTIMEKYQENVANAEPYEHDEQVQVIRAWDNNISRKYHLARSLLFAVPNGGARSPIVGKKLKDEGVRAGIPDLMLACPKAPYSGLYIEMKRLTKGGVSSSQAQVHNALRSQGYAVEVCRGHQEAITTIQDYLGGRYGKQ